MAELPKDEPTASSAFLFKIKGEGQGFREIRIFLEAKKENCGASIWK